jgi:hypothetical protein
LSATTRKDGRRKGGREESPALTLAEITLASDDDVLLESDAVVLDADEVLLDDGEGSQAVGKKLEPGQAEAEAAAEASEMLEGFRQRAKNEEQRIYEATDSEYWFCICFQIREQKEEFLRKLGWYEMGDKYLDGVLLAERLGIQLTTPTPPIRQIKFDKSYTEFAMTLEELEAVED